MRVSKLFEYEIPLVSHIFKYFSDTSNFHNFCSFHLIISLLIYLFLKPEILPYGILLNMNRHKDKYRTLSPRKSIFIQFVPCLLVFIYLHLHFPNGDIKSPASFCFIVSLVYRSMIYPFFRKPYASRYSLSSVIFSSLVHLHFGFCAGILTIFQPEVSIIKILLSFVCFLIVQGFVIFHDYIICKSRNEQPPYYVIMDKYGWYYVSCPQYGLQFLQWLIFSGFLDDTIDVTSYILYIAYFTFVRADRVHQLSIAMVANTPAVMFVASRKPCMPFVSGSKFFLENMF